jgi:hypothetical protein
MILFLNLRFQSISNIAGAMRKNVPPAIETTKTSSTSPLVSPSAIIYDRPRRHLNAPSVEVFNSSEPNIKPKASPLTSAGTKSPFKIRRSLPAAEITRNTKTFVKKSKSEGSSPVDPENQKPKRKVKTREAASTLNSPAESLPVDVEAHRKKNLKTKKAISSLDPPVEASKNAKPVKAKSADPSPVISPTLRSKRKREDENEEKSKKQKVVSKHHRSISTNSVASK